MQDALSGISKGGSYKMQELKSLTKLYEEISAKNKATEKLKEIRNNVIKTYPEEEIPVVEAPADPRVVSAEDQTIQLIAKSTDPGWLSRVRQERLLRRRRLRYRP